MDSGLSMNLDGRIVVVSGAGGGGIGTTVTRMAAEAGATVVAVSRTEANLDEHIAPLAGQGLPVVAVAADAATDDGIASVLDAVRTVSGETGAKLYGLVNVAGGAAPTTWMPSTRVSREDWRALFAANLETTFFMSQAVAAEIRGNGDPGSIVSISSISGMNTAPFHIAYGTAKAAVVAMTRTMAVELALDGIRVNAVAPGVTETAASATYVDTDPQRDRTAIAMGRRGTPAEQAGAILFLLSDLSGYITGQTLLVDGGLNLKWTHLGADNTSLFLKDESFRQAISRF
ncbi:MAG: SDR family oxidoreductase [Actinomycetota bacterium]|nr:SDR family oxidoreductase [Actinomycetota bacterium]